MTKKQRKGFSLAEALITLLIVCLVTIASVPVLTKKKRDTAKIPRGQWICTLNEQGKHVVFSSITGEWAVSGDSCKFIPPNQARNFEITAVGGGGGGASGYNESKIKRLYGIQNANQQDFEAPADGEYEATLVGGGGQGGNRQNDANRCKENAGGAGGSGGFDNKLIKLVKGKTYKLFAGTPGGNGGYNGSDGTASYIKDDKGNDMVVAGGGGGGYGRWGAACGQYSEKDPSDGNWGKRGFAGSPNGVQSYMVRKYSDENVVHSNYAILCKTGNKDYSNTTDMSKIKLGNKTCEELLGSKYFATKVSTFSYGSGEMTFYVYGLPYGYGGKGRDSMNMQSIDEGPDSGLYELDKDGNPLLDEKGNKIPYDESKHKDDPVVDPSAPSGGNGRTDGGMGALILRYNLIYSGDGGKAGYTFRPSVIPSMRSLTVKIDPVGKGATEKNVSGTKGGDLRYQIEGIDRQIIDKSVLGGAGGTPQFHTVSSASSAGKIDGGSGGVSPVRLLKSNANGGLGGYTQGNDAIMGQITPFLSRNYFGAGGGGGGANDGEWGKGGNGSPGALIIEW